ncbi:MAG: hypothetical protein R3C03_21555 [Pirellulaceae bacterium]
MSTQGIDKFKIEQRSSSIGKIVRLAIVTYGLIFIGLNGVGAALSLTEPVIVNVMNLILCTLVCYGIFALAFTSLRIWTNGVFWYWFSAALPFLIIVGFVGEIITDDSSLALTDWFGIGFFGAVIWTPAVICNFTLARELNKLHSESVSPKGPQGISHRRYFQSGWPRAATRDFMQYVVCQIPWFLSRTRDRE